MSFDTDIECLCAHSSYLALGYVASRGQEPPSRNIVRCVRCVGAHVL
jgi:hypothetical protein